MSIQFHVLIFSCYSAASVVAMLVLPKYVPGLSYSTSILFGLLFILAGSLIQEISSRTANERQTVRRLIVLRKAYNQNQKDLERNRDELRRVYEVLENFKTKDDASQIPGNIEEVASEVKVLHGLVDQLYSSGKTDTRPVTAATLDIDPSAEKGFQAPSVGARNVNDISGDLLVEIMRDALRHNRVDLHLQPIVTLPQRKRRFFESFIYIRSADGEVISPLQYEGAVREKNLSLAIDNMLLFRSVQLLQNVHKKNYSTAFFCNISADTFADQKFLSDFIEYLEINRNMAPCVVFQLSQPDLAARADDTGPDLQRLVNVGYRLCMNKVTDLNFDPTGLARLGFRFVKIHVNRLLKENIKPTPESIQSIKTSLDDAGVDLIIEGIDTEQELIELLDFNIDLGQGYLFGEPRISKNPSDETKPPELRVV